MLRVFPYVYSLERPTNIILGWKWKTVANTQTYYDTATITAVKKCSTGMWDYKTFYDRKLVVSQYKSLKP
jgi:hypothetical protein